MGDSYALTRRLARCVRAQGAAVSIAHSDSPVLGWLAPVPNLPLRFA